MKKTSIYLDDVDRERLCRLAEREGKSQALIIREAIAAYDASRPDRNFEMINAFADLNLPPLPKFKDAQGFQDYVDGVLMRGMGADAEEQLKR